MYSTQRPFFSAETKGKEEWAGEEESTVCKWQCQNSQTGMQELPQSISERLQKLPNNLLLWAWGLL